MADVIMLNNITTLDIPPERVLDKAREMNLKHIVICGYTQDEDEYFASSVSSGPDVLWLLERCKIALLNIVDE